MAKYPTEQEAERQHKERPRQPYSGDDSDPKGEKKENAAKRHEAEREHKHR